MSTSTKHRLLTSVGALASIAVASLASSPAFAEVPQPEPGAKPCAPIPELPPDPFAPGSLLVRFTAGPGYMWGSGDPDTGLQSAAGGFGFTMGAFAFRNLAFHGDFSWSNGFDPDFWVDGNVDHETNLIFQTATFRAGATYYSAPMRLYGTLGVGVGMAMMTSFYYLGDGSVTAAASEYSKAGPAFIIQVGKDWEVSRFWGLGLAVDYQYLHVNVDDDDARIVFDDAQQLGLRFVATFAGR